MTDIKQPQKDLPAGWSVAVLVEGADPVWSARQNLLAIKHHLDERKRIPKDQLFDNIDRLCDLTLEILKEAGR